MKIKVIGLAILATATAICLCWAVSLTPAEENAVTGQEMAFTEATEKKSARKSLVRWN